MTMHVPKGLLALVLIVAVVALTMVSTQGKASTGGPVWSDFGAGWARSGQRYEFPSVSLSGSKGHPNGIRFKVWSGRNGQRAYIDWDLTCWRGLNYGSRSGTLDERALPYTRQFTLPIANPDYCSLDVFAFLNTAGIIQVRLQNR